MEQTTKVKTGRVRFSYANVFEPTSIGESPIKKYNVSLLIPKEDTATIEAIEKAIEAAVAAGKDKLLDKSGKLAKNLKMPLRDGDLEKDDDSAYVGCMFVNANSSRKPGIVDKNLNEIMSKDEFYSGCYGRATVTFYAYNVDGNKGIACGLNNLQKLEEGENLSGGTSAIDDFDDELA